MVDEPTPEDNTSRLPQFIVGLLRPSAYPHPTWGIELLQTHISYVILTGPYAYKIKKAVNFGFLDYSTLEKRQYYCHEEVRLNSRLCPDLYVDVVEVSEANGHIFMGPGQRQVGDAVKVDYAVKMVQLPEERMMNRLLEHNQVTPDMVRQLAAKLVMFYKTARGGRDVEQYGGLHWIRINTEENFDQTRPFINRTISARQFQLIKQYTQQFLIGNEYVFEERIKQGRIRDGHGDLRPDSVCFANDLCVFDCIEFNERFRCGDVASDIAFLIMELEVRRKHDLAREFVQAYIQLSDDRGVHEVLNFYKVYRAFVRGKVESFKLDEPEMPETEKQQGREAARRYFDLAASYVSGMAVS